MLAVAADEEGVVGLEQVGFLQVRGAFVRGEEGVVFVVDGGDARGGGVVFDVEVGLVGSVRINDFLLFCLFIY